MYLIRLLCKLKWYKADSTWQQRLGVAVIFLRFLKVIAPDIGAVAREQGAHLLEWHGTVVICGLRTVFSSWTRWKITAPLSSAVGLEPHDRTVTSGMRVEVMLRAGSWLALTKILQNFLNLSFLAALTLRSHILCALATRWTRATRPALQFIWGINKAFHIKTPRLWSLLLKHYVCYTDKHKCILCVEQ